MTSEIKSKYMVSVTLPEYFDNAFLTLIPKQREVVGNLINERIIESYVVSAEEPALWIVVNAESEDIVHAVIASLPIYERIDYSVSKIAFQRNAFAELPHFSLN